MALDLTRKEANEAQDPTLLDDATATRMGRKVYQHGDSYNGGGAPTLTLAGGGGSLNAVNHSFFIPYQMQDGSWRMRFNFRVDLTTTTRTTVEVAVAGITFSSGSAVTGSFDPSSGNSITAPSTFVGGGTVRWDHASVSSVRYQASGDVALTAKPTWAY